MISIIKEILSFILNILFKPFPIKNKIVFECGRGLIDGNPKAIYDYMKEIKQTKYRLIWLVEKGTDVSALDKNEYVYYKKLKAYYHLATAKYWIRSQSIGSIIKKRKGQIYIQLWHGNGALKKMGYDVTNIKKRPPMEHVLNWDYYIASDKLDGKVIKTSTGFNKNIEVLGMACVDNTIKLNNSVSAKNKIREELGIKNTNKKIILYAPTFRDFDLDKSDIIDIPIKKLKELKDYIVLIRLHPLVRNKIDKNLFINSNFINACNYPDASDLLPISDILITDYSSLFYQYAPLNRPIVFYPYDYEEYIKLRGGFYLDYEKELPGPICKTEDELYKTLNDINKIYDNYEQKLRKFNEKYGTLSDGMASKRFVDKLMNDEFN